MSDQVDTTCGRCGCVVGEPDTICDGCIEASRCPSCWLGDTGGDLCDACQEINDEIAREEAEAEAALDADVLDMLTELDY